MIRRLLQFTFLLSLVAYPAYAHHAATATFDTSTDMEIEGYVKDFSFRNPHVTITLAVTDENGEEAEWIATAPAIAGFRRWGWTEAMLEEGQYVRLVGRKARHGGPMILLERADIEGGRLLEVNPEDGTLVRVLTGPSPNQTPDDLVIPALTLEDERPNISGTWLAAAPGTGPRRTAPELTEAGQLLQDTYDPATDPAFTECQQPGLVRSISGNQSVRVTQHDDYVLLEQEGDGSRRLIYLDGRAPQSEEHLRLGSSVAHYDEDALVIESSQLTTALSSMRGHTLSEQTTVVETYRRGDDEENAALQATFVVTDPVNLSAPWELAWRKLQTHDYTFIEPDCHLPVFSSLD